MRRILCWLLLASLWLTVAFAAIPRTKTNRKASVRKASVRKKGTKVRKKPVPVPDPTEGDNIDGDDLPVRRAALEALGGYNGSVVVVDPATGRILTVVNQKLAYRSGFTPCSTIKLVTAAAALSEGLITRDTPIRLGRFTTLNLTSAIAKSNNPFFSILGERLGYERVRRYAQMFGMGEKATLDLEAEQPGLVPDEPIKDGGVRIMTAFGEGFTLTPLELASMLTAVANGGTLYYLQYPRSQEDIDSFVPRIKRRLEIEPWISDIKVGMRAAVDFGTARRAGYDPTEPVLGKTGTCTDFRNSVHLGWFGSFNDVGRNKLVVVVLLTGGRPVNGPVAAGVAGSVYRSLSQQRYFAREGESPDLGLVTTQSCCAR